MKISLKKVHLDPIKGIKKLPRQNCPCCCLRLSHHDRVMRNILWQVNLLHWRKKGQAANIVLSI